MLNETKLWLNKLLVIVSTNLLALGIIGIFSTLYFAPTGTGILSSASFPTFWRWVFWGWLISGYSLARVQNRKYFILNIPHINSFFIRPGEMVLTRQRQSKF